MVFLLTDGEKSLWADSEKTPSYKKKRKLRRKVIIQESKKKIKKKKCSTGNRQLRKRKLLQEEERKVWREGRPKRPGVIKRENLLLTVSGNQIDTRKISGNSCWEQNTAKTIFNPCADRAYCCQILSRMRDPLPEAPDIGPERLFAASWPWEAKCKALN